MTPSPRKTKKRKRGNNLSPLKTLYKARIAVSWTTQLMTFDFLSSQVKNTYTCMGQIFFCRHISISTPSKPILSLKYALDPTRRKCALALWPLKVLLITNYERKIRPETY